MVQRKAARDGVGAARIPEGGGSPIAPEIRARMEPQLGADLSHVKLHTGGESATAAERLGARAFTTGSDVHFGAGEFAPGTKEGDRLLAHELTHVVQGQRSGIQRKADHEGEKHDAAADGKHGDHEDGAHPKTGAHDGADHDDHEVSRPGDPAEKEADAVADKVTDKLHGGHGGGQSAGGGGHEKQGKHQGAPAHDDAAGEKKPGQEKAPAIGAKLSGKPIFRAAGDPKSVAELVPKLTGKALEAYNQMKELDQQRAIDGICSGAKVKQSDGTLNVPAAQAAFEGRWLDGTQFAAKKLLKDQAFKKKIDDALATIKNGCDETDGTNRPGASLGDGTSETALGWEAENGKPWKSAEGHYQKVPGYIGSIQAAVDLLSGEQSKITDATMLDQITKAIDRGQKRITKMNPSVETWKNRVTLHPAVWKSDGDSKIQPGFPKVK
jgi:hypothetical protein